MEPVVVRAITRPSQSLMSEQELFNAYRNSTPEPVRCAMPKCQAKISPDEASIFCLDCWTEMSDGRST